VLLLLNPAFLQIPFLQSCYCRLQMQLLLCSAQPCNLGCTPHCCGPLQHLLLLHCQLLLLLLLLKLPMCQMTVGREHVYRSPLLQQLQQCLLLLLLLRQHAAAARARSHRCEKL
jgi:hypothetical protein